MSDELIRNWSFKDEKGEAVKRHHLTNEELERVRDNWNKVDSVSISTARVLRELLDQQAEDRSRFWEQIRVLAGFTKEEINDMLNIMRIEWVTGDIVLYRREIEKQGS